MNDGFDRGCPCLGTARPTRVRAQGWTLNRGARAALPLAVLALLAARATPQGPGELERLPTDPFRHLPELVREELAAVDPSRADWASEATHIEVQAELSALADWLRGVATEPPASCRVLGAYAELPAQEPVLAGNPRPNAVFRVLRAAPASAGDPGKPRRVPLAQLAAWLGEMFPGGLETVEFKVDTIREQDARVQVRAYFAARGHTASALRSEHARWGVDWRRGQAGRLELERIRIGERERVTVQGPVFVDDTAALFGGELPAQLSLGTDAWRRRLDARLGTPLLGHAAGIALGDVDGDGLLDVYLAQPGGLPNKLFLHGPPRLGGRLLDVSRASRADFLEFSRAALLVDLDGDDDRDLIVSVRAQILVLANDGHARFEDRGALPAPESTSLALSDYDLDGDLDLYVCAYVSPYDGADVPLPYHDAENGFPNTLWDNAGGWSFTDATEEVGLGSNNSRFSFAASWEDYDLDGDPDLYVANDFGRNNLYRNDAAHFRDVAAQAGVEDISAGMGVSWGDFDGDGWMDLYVSNMSSAAGMRVTYQRQFQQAADAQSRRAFRRHARGNTLFRNLGDGTFADVAESARVTRARWSWGSIFVDLDQDGRQDIFCPNGFLSQERGHDL